MDFRALFNKWYGAGLYDQKAADVKGEMDFDDEDNPTVYLMSRAVKEEIAAAMNKAVSADDYTLALANERRAQHKLDAIRLRIKAAQARQGAQYDHELKGEKQELDRRDKAGSDLMGEQLTLRALKEKRYAAALDWLAARYELVTNGWVANTLPKYGATLGAFTYPALERNSSPTSMLWVNGPDPKNALLESGDYAVLPGGIFEHDGEPYVVIVRRDCLPDWGAR